MPGSDAETPDADNGWKEIRTCESALNSQVIKSMKVMQDARLETKHQNTSIQQELLVELPLKDTILSIFSLLYLDSYLRNTKQEIEYVKSERN